MIDRVHAEKVTLHFLANRNFEFFLALDDVAAVEARLYGGLYERGWTVAS